ncbi:MAG: SRPBCC domain-containing protein [Chloroflexi bacterium]|nr:SRPBCC domain-containing protein [Chloroflexota bacterium]
MDSEKHSAFTCSVAVISREVGGDFTVYDGDITGTNRELTPDKQIVQSWRSADWPAGHYSRATFLLEVVPGGTRLTFTQSGVPHNCYDSVLRAWNDYYWQPMKAMLERA